MTTGAEILKSSGLRIEKKDPVIHWDVRGFGVLHVRFRTHVKFTRLFQKGYREQLGILEDRGDHVVATWTETHPPIFPPGEGANWDRRHPHHRPSEVRYSYIISSVEEMEAFLQKVEEEGRLSEELEGVMLSSVYYRKIAYEIQIFDVKLSTKQFRPNREWLPKEEIARQLRALYFAKDFAQE